MNLRETVLGLSRRPYLRDAIWGAIALCSTGAVWIAVAFVLWSTVDG